MPEAGPDAEDPLPALVDALRGFTDLWRSRSRHEEFNSTLPVPLDSTEGWLVWHLDGGRPLRATDLSRATGIGKAGVSKALHRLQRQAIVVLTPDPSDDRAAHVRLTDHGQSVASAMHRAAAEMIGRSVVGWTIAEQRTLTALLTRLTISQAGGTSAV